VIDLSFIKRKTTGLEKLNSYCVFQKSRHKLRPCTEKGKINRFLIKKKFSNNLVNEIMGFKVLKILDSNVWHLL